MIENISTWNMLANSSEEDFNYSYNLSDAVQWAEFVEMVNDVDIEHEEE